jgi:hypothetical protein
MTRVTRKSEATPRLVAPGAGNDVIRVSWALKEGAGCGLGSRPSPDADFGGDMVAPRMMIGTISPPDALAR